jgi:hypothetical protein
VFTLLKNLEIFISEDVKNKEYVHTWDNSKSYTSTKGYWNFVGGLL